MASMKDVRDILSLDEKPSSDQVGGLGSIVGPDKKKSTKKSSNAAFKRPDGMHRELYALLYSDKKDVPPLIPSDFPSKLGGYRHSKVKLGLKKPSKWVWSSFKNPGRKDSLELHHWTKVEDESKDYPFAKFNKVLDVPSYSFDDYKCHLYSSTWSQAETDHLVELCGRFDLRWPVILDRYNHEKFCKRSIEDMKERYFEVCNLMAKAKCPPGEEAPVLYFDAEHERRRKEQMEKLYNRTKEEVEEEENLLTELKKIEARRKERERKAQDLQKLITAADIGVEQMQKSSGGGGMSASASTSSLSALSAASTSEKKRKLPTSKAMKAADSVGSESTPAAGSIKWPESKGPGVSLRSLRLKLPGSLGQKKVKALESLLDELGLDLNPIATEDICEHFNQLRSDLVLLYELRSALASCQFDLESMRHQYNALTGQELELPSRLKAPVCDEYMDADVCEGASVCNLKRRLDELLEIGLPQRRRKSAVTASSTSADIQRKLRSN